MGGRQAPVPAWALHVPATKALKLDIASKKKKTDVCPWRCQSPDVLSCAQTPFTKEHLDAGGGGTQYMANGNTHPAQSAQRGFFPVSPERRGTKNTQFIHAHMFR